ncbi:unnamed protein product [Microthlaspi erraticum]|uniref:Nucleoplasmin-like domain-containing protein n=1 Tax=Microthlaspi erraticum TaxID=1685480 RepID=A0A6D2HTQ8_9BRAS|nr:unnamed protein product [Microthlaspi erraticum]
MAFWGIEIKPGNPIKVEANDGYFIHLSQVTLGESKKVKDEIVPVFVKVGDDKTRFLVGNLSQKIPQLSINFMIEQDFELSHDCKTSSVYLLGTKIPDMDAVNSEFDSEDEDIPMYMFQNELASNDQKAMEAAESDSNEEDESDSDEVGSDEDEDDSDEEEEEEEAPLKVEPPSKKGTNGGATNNKQKPKHAHDEITPMIGGSGCCCARNARRRH